MIPGPLLTVRRQHVMFSFKAYLVRQMDFLKTVQFKIRLHGMCNLIFDLYCSIKKKNLPQKLILMAYVWALEMEVSFLFSAE